MIVNDTPSARRRVARVVAGIFALAFVVAISLDGFAVQAQQTSFFSEYQKYRRTLEGNSPEELADEVETRAASPEYTEFDALCSAEIVSSLSLTRERLDKTLASLEARFPESWSVKCAVAQTYSRLSFHLNQIGASEEARGVANVARARAIQTVAAARELALRRTEPNGALPECAPFRKPSDATRLFLSILAPSLTNTAVDDYVRLQALTPLDKEATIPPNFYRFKDALNFLPTTDEDAPLFFATPESFETAKNDGERYMALAAEYREISDPVDNLRYRCEWAGQVARLFGAKRYADLDLHRRDAKSIAVLDMIKSLKDDETVVRVKEDIRDPNEFIKVKLPKEYDYLATYRESFQPAAQSESDDLPLLLARFDLRVEHNEKLWTKLADEYLCRGRKDLALATYQKRLEDCDYILNDLPQNDVSLHPARSSATDDKNKIKRLVSEIVEPLAYIVGYLPESFPGALEISSQYVSKLCFKVYRLNVDYVLNQMKNPALFSDATYPSQPSFSAMLAACAREDFEDEKSGGRRNARAADLQPSKSSKLKPTQNRKVIVDVAAEWSVDVAPDPRGQFQTTRVEIPQIEPGNYYVAVETPSSDGSGKNVLLTGATLQLPRSYIVRKMFDDGFRYFFIDPKTGAPRVGADVVFYSAFKRAEKGPRTTYEFETFSQKTDDSGSVLLPYKKEDGTFARYGSVLAVAQEETPSFLDFAPLSRPWEVDSLDDLKGAAYCGNISVKPSERFKRTLATIAFDRTVAGEGDVVHFVFRADQASYETSLDAPSPYANAELSLKIFVYPRSPAGSLFFNEKIKLDADGAYVGSFTIPRDPLGGLCEFEATLGDAFFSVGAPIGNLRVLGRSEVDDSTNIVLTCPQKTPTRDEAFAIDALATAPDGTPIANAPFDYEIIASEATPQAYPNQTFDWLYGKGYGAFNPGASEILGDAAPAHLGKEPIIPNPARYLEPIKGEATSDDEGKFKIEIASSSNLTELVGDVSYVVRVGRKPEASVPQWKLKTFTTRARAAQSALRVDALRDKGFYRVGDAPVLRLFANATAPSLTPKKASLALVKVERDANGAPAFADVETQSVDLVDGKGEATLPRLDPGQYRLSVAAETPSGDRADSATLFVVRGESGFDAPLFADSLELVPNKAEYAPGETATIQILSSNPDAVVELCGRSASGELSGDVRFVPLENGVGYVDVPLSEKDVPNAFVEASTVANGECAARLVELILPPRERMIDVETTYDVVPGEGKVKARAKLLDHNGAPVQGRVLVFVYDSRLDPNQENAVLYDFRKEYWKWTRFSELLNVRNASFVYPTVETIDSRNFGVIKQTRAEPERVRVPSYARTRDETRESIIGVARAELQTRVLDPAATSEPLFWAPNMTTDASGVVEFEFNVPKDVPNARAKVVAFGKGETVGSDLSEIVLK